MSISSYKMRDKSGSISYKKHKERIEFGKLSRKYHFRGLNMERTIMNHWMENRYWMYRKMVSKQVKLNR